MTSIFDIPDKKVELDKDNTNVLWFYTEYILLKDGTIKAGKHYNGVKGVKTTKSLKKTFELMPKIEMTDEVFLD